jgi:hypothetical protein
MTIGLHCLLLSLDEVPGSLLTIIDGFALDRAPPGMIWIEQKGSALVIISETSNEPLNRS